MHKAKTKMPIQIVHGKKVVLQNPIYKDKYWPILTQLVFEKIGETEVKNSEKVQEILKECFSKLCLTFQEKLSEENRASFYIFCHNIHEDSIELFLLQLQKIPLGINEEDFAGSRRILKIILEQSSKLDLIGTPNFFLEIVKNIESYKNLLEELLYVGSWCFIISEHIARSQLFGTSTGIQIIDNELNILTYQPYPELFKYAFLDLSRHDSKVSLSDSIDEFKEIIYENYNVKYDDLASFIQQQIIKPEYRLGLTKIEPMKNEIIKSLDCDENFVNDFYAGLTLNRNNCLSIEKCFFNNQSEFRYLYRPILELIVDGEIYNLIGYHKWIESLSQLSTNSFPFGLYPNEWINHKALKKFIQRVDNTHDKILEDPIIEILKENSFLHDANVESFEQANGRNINIKNTVGDLDVLFIDKEFELIYVCECKHNRSRFDMNNWRRDYSNFKAKYEAQLSRKVNWAAENKDVIATHFSIKNNETLDFSKYQVKGIFIINAPTIYMHNGAYRAFTITDFDNLAKRNYRDVKFAFTDEVSGKKTIIEYPYFDNIKENFG